MGQAVGEILVLAVGVAVSPVPIMPVVLILGTPGARTNGPAFVLGWLAGLLAIGAILLLVLPDGDDRGGPATWVSVLKLALGVLLVVLAARQLRGRPRGDGEASVPGWVGAVDRLSAPRALGIGLALGAANPKNLLLAAAAAASIAETGIPGGEQALAYAVFAVIGTVGVAVPVVVYFALGDRAAAPLDGLQRWMARNNAVILSVIFVVIAAKLIGDAIGGLSS